jgi:hypothetical protein
MSIRKLLKWVWESGSPNRSTSEDRQTKQARRYQKRLTYIRNKECELCAEGSPLHSPPTKELLDALCDRNNPIPNRFHIVKHELTRTDDLGCSVRYIYEQQVFCAAEWILNNLGLLTAFYPETKRWRYA